MFKRLTPFWFFLFLFKCAASLHYSLLSPLGSKVFPLWAVGLLVGLGSLMQLIFDVPAGYLLDRYGYRRLLKVTTLIFMIAAAILFAGITQITFILSLFVGTFGWLFFGPGI